MPKRQPRWFGASVAEAGLVAWLALGTPGCRVLFGESTQPPKAAPDEPVDEMSNDPERGMKHLSSLMRQFNDAVANKQFDVAEKVLHRAEVGVDKSSVVTRSHPDFDDMTDDVQRARPRLTLAIETDRIERRNAAIDALIERGKAVMQQNGTWSVELANRAPTNEDVRQLDEAVHIFSELKQSGDQYLDEPRYRAHAQQRDAMGAQLMALDARSAKQLQLAAVVGPEVDAGYAAADKARAAASPAEQLAAYKEVGLHFSNCTQAIVEHLRDPQMNGGIVIDTRLGRLSLNKTQAQCNAALGQANDKINRFGWDVLVGKLNQILPAARGNGSAANAAQADAIAALNECSTSKPGALTGGVANKAVFDTPLGKLKYAQLVQACAKEAAKLKARGGVVGWQARLEDARDRANAAMGELTQGNAEGVAPQRTVDLMAHAAGGFTECMERTEALAKEGNADKKYKVASAWGEVAVTELNAACKHAGDDTRARMPAAISAAKQATFLQTCKGDESAVVAREGVPTNVEAVGPGRVFIYAAKRIAFDAQGMRTEESLLRASAK